MGKYHEISDLKFINNSIKVTIDGKEKEYQLKDISPVLERASEDEKNTFEISPSGYGIYWPLLDEDISIDGLLGIVHTPDNKIKIA